jgi:hypothetical protein
MDWTLIAIIVGTVVVAGTAVICMALLERTVIEQANGVITLFDQRLEDIATELRTLQQRLR